MRRRTLEVEHVTRSCAYVRGAGARELIIEATGIVPTWGSIARAWVIQPFRVADLIAAAELRHYDVTIVGPRSRRARVLDALMAAPAPRWPEQPDPAEGRW